MSMSMSPAAARWAALVAELEDSKLPVGVFAQRRGVNRSTLAWWRSRFRGLARANALDVPEPAFVELALESQPDRPLRLRLDHRPVVLEVTPGVSLELLRSVLDALC